MSELHSPDYDDNPEVVHEESDVNVRAILGYGIALACVTAVVLAFLWWLQGFYATRTARAQTTVFPMAAGQQNQLPPEPRLQSDPQQELRDLQTRQQSQLTSYGWVNKEAGVVRIPIEEAMRLVVERGVPARETAK